MAGLAQVIWVAPNGITIGWSTGGSSIHAYSSCCKEEIHWVGSAEDPEWECSKCRVRFEWARGNKFSGTWNVDGSASSIDQVVYLVNVWGQIPEEDIAVAMEKTKHEELTGW